MQPASTIPRPKASLPMRMRWLFSTKRVSFMNLIDNMSIFKLFIHYKIPPFFKGGSGGLRYSSKTLSNTPSAFSKTSLVADIKTVNSSLSLTNSRCHRGSSGWARAAAFPGAP